MTSDVANNQRHLASVQRQMVKDGIAAMLLFDPVNMRYASGFINEQVFQFHTPSSYLFVPAEGKATLFHQAAKTRPLELGTIGEIRDAIAFTTFSSGPRVNEQAESWAREVADLVRRHGGSDNRLAVDRIDPAGVAALDRHGIRVIHGHSYVEYARAIKTPDDVAGIERALAVAEAGMAAMQEALGPGITENALWSLLHQKNIELGGSWIETRLLTSGPRTNPWLQECSDRLIRPNELVAFDTDMIGPQGYCADISRTFFSGPGTPTSEQKRLYNVALEQIYHNTSIISPGISFREYAEKAWVIPDEFVRNRYAMITHGIGLGDEYPHIAHLHDWEEIGYDGVIEPNMVLCVESYIGAHGGDQGVKLEEQVLVTDTGYRVLSKYPWDSALIG